MSAGQPKKVIIKKVPKIRKKHQPARNASMPPPSSEAEANRPLVFHFYCSYCGQKIPSRKDRAGTRVHCSVCDHEVIVPEPLEGEGPSARTRAGTGKEQLFKFFCTYCGQKLSASESMVGRPTSCPTCKSPLTIPEPRTIEVKGGAREKRLEGVFKFFCQYCGTKLSVLRQWEGSAIRCPGCKAEIVIPPPRA